MSSAWWAACCACAGCEGDRCAATESVPSTSALQVRSKRLKFPNRCMIIRSSCLLRRIHERLVDDIAAQVLNIRTSAMHPLNHSYKYDVVSGIDPEPCSRGAVPEERAFAVRQVSLWRIVDDGTVVPVTKARPQNLKADAVFARQQLDRHMVCGHQMHGGRRQNSRAIQLASIGQHLREAVIVLSR